MTPQEQELYLSPEAAICMKRNGFDEPCAGYFWSMYSYAPYKVLNISLQLCTLGEEKECAGIHKHEIDFKAPMHAQVKNWFVKNHNIKIFVTGFPVPGEEISSLLDNLYSVWIYVDGKIAVDYCDFETEHDAYNHAFISAVRFIKKPEEA